MYGVELCHHTAGYPSPPVMLIRARQDRSVLAERSAGGPEFDSART